MTPWWRAPDAPSHMTLWWAVEHMGHPAFYLRALMPGDFGPYGRGPLPRHAYDLQGKQLEDYPVLCCTCTLVPDPILLEPIERMTGHRGRARFFALYMHALEPWPQATAGTTCWLCSQPGVPANDIIDGRKVCRSCARSMLLATRS